VEVFNVRYPRGTPTRLRKGKGKYRISSGREGEVPDVRYSDTRDPRIRAAQLEPRKVHER
jgi:hypothetical protein